MPPLATGCLAVSSEATWWDTHPLRTAGCKWFSGYGGSGIRNATGGKYARSRHHHSITYASTTITTGGTTGNFAFDKTLSNVYTKAGKLPSNRVTRRLTVFEADGLVLRHHHDLTVDRVVRGQQRTFVVQMSDGDVGGMDELDYDVRDPSRNSNVDQRRRDGQIRTAFPTAVDGTCGTDHTRLQIGHSRCRDQFLSLGFAGGIVPKVLVSWPIVTGPRLWVKLKELTD
jgi:hypothetical protein